MFSFLVTCKMKIKPSGKENILPQNYLNKTHFLRFVLLSTHTYLTGCMLCTSHFIYVDSTLQKYMFSLKIYLYRSKQNKMHKRWTKYIWVPPVHTHMERQTKMYVDLIFFLHLSYMKNKNQVQHFISSQVMF